MVFLHAETEPNIAMMCSLLNTPSYGTVHLLDADMDIQASSDVGLMVIAVDIIPADEDDKEREFTLLSVPIHRLSHIGDAMLGILEWTHPAVNWEIRHIMRMNDKKLAKCLSDWGLKAQNQYNDKLNQIRLFEKEAYAKV